MHKTDFDAIVAGSGPDGLSATALQQAGLAVLLVEGNDTVGGGMRSAEPTLPGFVHDVCAAIHLLAVASPFLCPGGLGIKALISALRWSPYHTSARGLYICSTTPGGGVHGMCGYHAAQRMLRDLFSLNHLLIQPLHYHGAVK